MPLKIPPELKKINAFVKRAEELDRDKSPESRLVAYFCRQYAVQSGIALATSPDGKRCLGELLNQLESEKPAMSTFTPDESHVICKKFADRIFDKANAEDTAGAATKGTAKTFYAAASFYEILQQFYPGGAVEEEDKSDEQKEEERKRLYCKWKATEILKAIKEGRTPEPGGYQKNEEADTGGEGSIGEAPVEAPSTDIPPALPPAEDEADEIFVPKPPPLEVESPDVFVPKPPPPVNDDDDDDDDVFVPKPPPVEDGRNDDEGTEVDLYGPVPGYHDVAESHGPNSPKAQEILPKWGENKGKKSNGGAIDRPPMSNFKPPPPTPAPAPAPVRPAPAPAPAPVRPAPAPVPSRSSSASSSGWGAGAKKGRVSKEDLSDAKELTKFALAALENKDPDLAAERLRQALDTLGR